MARFLSIQLVSDMPLIMSWLPGLTARGDEREPLTPELMHTAALRVAVDTGWAAG